MYVLLVLVSLNVWGLAPALKSLNGRDLRVHILQSSIDSSEEISRKKEFVKESLLGRATDTVIQIENDCALDEECQSRIQETIIQLDQIEASAKESPQEELKVPSSFNFFLITHNLLKECKSIEYHLLTQICMTLFQIYECGLLYVSGDYVNLTYQVLLITTFQLLPLIPHMPMSLINGIISVNRILMKPVPYVLAHIVQLAIRLLFVCVQSRFLKRNEIYIRSLLYVLTYLYFGENYNPRFLYEEAVEFITEEQFDLLSPKEIMMDNNLHPESCKSFCFPMDIRHVDKRVFLPIKQSPRCIQSVGGRHIRKNVDICFIEEGKVLRKMHHFVGEFGSDINDGALIGYQVWYHYRNHIKHLIPLCDLYQSSDTCEELKISAITPVVKYSLKDLLNLSMNQNKGQDNIQTDFNEILLYQRSMVAIHDFTRNNLCFGDVNIENLRTTNGRDMLLMDLDFSKRGICPRSDYVTLGLYLSSFDKGLHSNTKVLFESLNQTDRIMALGETLKKADYLEVDTPYLEGKGANNGNFAVQVLRELPPLLKELTLNIESVLEAFPSVYYERFVQMIREKVDSNSPFPSQIKDLFYKEPTYHKLIELPEKKLLENRLWFSKRSLGVGPQWEKSLTLASPLTVHLVKKNKEKERCKSKKNQQDQFNIRITPLVCQARVNKCA